MFVKAGLLLYHDWYQWLLIGIFLGKLINRNQYKMTTLRKLNIETSSQCNLSCRMCVRAAWSDSMGNMSLETYHRLLPTFPRLNSIALSGYGEPLLNSHLVEMIKLAKTTTFLLDIS